MSVPTFGGSLEMLREVPSIGVGEMRASRPSVAAIIPCFNSARFLGEALESALGQTYPVDDILVVNDGSTDDFAEVVRPFRPRVRVLEQANRGASRSRNVAIECTTATYLAFLDADDRWHPNKIERQVAFLETHPGHGLVHTAPRIIGAAGELFERSPLAPRPARVAPEKLLEELIGGGNFIVISSVLLRRSALGDQRFMVGHHFCEDWDLWIRLASRVRFGYLDEELTHIRVHGGNISANTKKMVEASLGVLERAERREKAPAIRRAARRHHRTLLRSLANLEYESGNLRRARQLFDEAAPFLHPTDVIRYLATHLPAPAYRRVRVLWQTLLRTPSRPARTVHQLPKVP